MAGFAGLSLNKWAAATRPAVEVRRFRAEPFLFLRAVLRIVGPRSAGTSPGLRPGPAPPETFCTRSLSLPYFAQKLSSSAALRVAALSVTDQAAELPARRKNDEGLGASGISQLWREEPCSRTTNP